MQKNVVLKWQNDSRPVGESIKGVAERWLKVKSGRAIEVQRTIKVAKG